MPVAVKDLFARVKAKVNKDFVRAFLAAIPNEHSVDVRLNVNLPELVDQIEAAHTAGRISVEEVLALLQEHEENGKQSILYYVPKTEEAHQLCHAPEEIAKRLFGLGWRGEFPKSVQLDNGWEVVDFRIGLPGKPGDWLMKLYTFQESRVRVREMEPQEIRLFHSLQEGEYAVIYKRQVTESVCLVRWNNHPQRSLLELRFEMSGRTEHFTTDKQIIWSRLRSALDEEHFESWELSELLKRMLRACSQTQVPYQIGNAQLTDSGDGTVRYIPYTEHDTIDAAPIRLQTINQILDDGGRCSRLTVNWLSEQSEGALEKDLRTYAGSRQSNELVISAQTTAKAVDYVTNQLRYFAS